MYMKRGFRIMIASWFNETQRVCRAVWGLYNFVSRFGQGRPLQLQNSLFRHARLNTAICHVYGMLS